MLNHLIEWSLTNKFLVLALAFLLVIAGINTSMNSDVDVLPEFAPPQVIVQTEAPGLVAEEVESLVSLPLEAALNGTPNVTLVKSLSLTGLSSITVIFTFGTDIYRARQLVAERLQSVRGTLPHSVGEPTMLPLMSVVGDVLKLGLTSEKLSPMQLRTICDWDIRNRLLAVPGVARVLIMGGDQKEFQVLINPDKLKAYDVSLSDVEEAVKEANVISPSGYLTSTDQQLPIRGVGRIEDIQELANSVVINRKDAPVLLRHIADVRIGSAFKYGDAIINGKSGIEIIVTKQPGVQTIEVTKRLDEALNEIQQTVGKDIEFTTIFRQAHFIEKSISNVLFAVFAGAVLVVFVIFSFLANWRTALISLTAIPLSILSAILVIKGLGGNINTMTLGGLAIAVGEVVDDAIVDVENVFRRLQENSLLEHPRPVFMVILDACREVRSSVVYATFIVALVFLPVFALSGVEGRLFGPLGYSYIAATLSSLVVALTVTPALCIYMLSDTKSRSVHQSPITLTLKKLYSETLPIITANCKTVVIAAFITFFLTLCLLPTFGQSFLPDFQEDNVIVTMTALAGQSLEATARSGIAIERSLLEHPDIVAIGQRVGRAQLDDDAGGPNYSELDLKVKETNRPIQEILADMRQHLNEIPGISFDVGSFIKHRMDDVLSGGTRADIAIKVFGPDLNTLRKLSVQIEDILRSVPGCVDVRSEPQVPIRELLIKIDRAKASRYGLSADDLSNQIEAVFNGKIISQVLENQKLFNLKLWVDERFRHNIDQIEETPIYLANESTIPLSQIANVSFIEGPSAIIREHVARRIVIQANRNNRDLVSVVEDIKKIIAKNIELPSGYYIVYSGQYAAQQEATHTLFLTSLLSMCAIFILLHQGLGSWKATFLVAANLPLATIGGIFAVAITGSVISIGSIIGFISLFGISTRNSLLLVTHVNDLIRQGLPFEEALYKGCQDRLTPILMTASTAGLGMLPLAVLGGAGRELEQPLAVVIVGGLVSSTILTLVVIPALYTLTHSNKKASL